MVDLDDIIPKLDIEIDKELHHHERFGDDIEYLKSIPMPDTEVDGRLKELASKKVSFKDATEFFKGCIITPPKLDIPEPPEFDWSSLTQQELANYNKNLETILNCNDPKLRYKALLACRKSDVIKFINDPDPVIRAKIADAGFDDCLDILVHDDDSFVRSRVALRKRDKDLDILVNDPDVMVRDSVITARRPKDLKLLANDKSSFISFRAKLMLRDLQNSSKKGDTWLWYAMMK